MAAPNNIKKTSWFKELDPIDKNFIARLTVDPRGGDRDTTLKYTGNTISRVFNKQLQNVADIRNIFKVLPQLSFPRKVLVSSILSPGDITKTGIVVDNSLKLSDYSLSSQMTNIVRELLEEDLEIPTRISKWLDDALILDGSHPILTLPSSVVDTIMGVSMESSNRWGSVPDSEYLKPLGLIGVQNEKGVAVSLESTRGSMSSVKPWEMAVELPKNEKGTGQCVDLNIVLTDNPAILGKAILNELKIKQSTANVYGDLSLESMIRYPDEGGKKPKFMPSDIRRELFRSSTDVMDRILILPTPKDVEENVNVGHPLEFHLSAECTIVVSTPGDPQDHSHYIILLDDNGYPLSGMDRLQTMQEMQNIIRKSNDSSSVVSGLLNSATAALGISGGGHDVTVIDEMARIGSALVESEITRSLMAGVNGGRSEIKISEPASKLMLSRILKGKRTVMLYVPADYITYIAFNYNELGIGKSILEDSKSMAGMLSTLTVASVIGAVEQAIPGKHLSIKLDPQDKDPLGTATFMSREAMDLDFRRFPMGLNSTVGVAEELQMNSYSVSIEGHPAFPEVSTEMRAMDSARKPIDTELMDKLNDYMHLIFSIPPEMIGSSNQADFATTVVANNLMLLKTVVEIQTVANKHLSRYGRNYVRYSGVMVAKFFALIKDNVKDLPKEYKSDIPGFIRDFIDSIRVSLPSPETNNLTHQIELLEQFSQAIDAGSDAFLNEESLLLEGYRPEIIQTVLPALKLSYKHHAMRQYMRERGILSEMDIFRLGDEDNPIPVLSEELKLHSKHVIRSVRKFILTTKELLKPEIKDLKGAVRTLAEGQEKTQEINDAAQSEDSHDGGDQDYGGDGVDDGAVDDSTGDSDSGDGDVLDDDDIGTDPEGDGGLDEDPEGTGDDDVEDPEDESSVTEEEDSEEDSEEKDEEKDEDPEELPIDSVDEEKL